MGGSNEDLNSIIVESESHLKKRDEYTKVNHKANIKKFAEIKS